MPTTSSVSGYVTNTTIQDGPDGPVAQSETSFTTPGARHPRTGYRTAAGGEAAKNGGHPSYHNHHHHHHQNHQQQQAPPRGSSHGAGGPSARTRGSVSGPDVPSIPPPLAPTKERHESVRESQSTEPLLSRTPDEDADGPPTPPPHRQPLDPSQLGGPPPASAAPSVPERPTSYINVGMSNSPQPGAVFTLQANRRDPPGRRDQPHYPSTEISV